MLPFMLLTVMASGSPPHLDDVVDPAAPPASPDSLEPPEGQPSVEAQHFCCADTWKDEFGRHGSECETIGADLVRVCINGGGSVLYCSGDWSGGVDIDC